MENRMIFEQFIDATLLRFCENQYCFVDVCCSFPLRDVLCLENVQSGVLK